MAPGFVKEYLFHFRIGWIPHNRVNSGKVLTRKQALENFLNSLTSSASGGLVFNIYEVDYQSIAMHCKRTIHIRLVTYGTL